MPSRTGARRRLGSIRVSLVLLALVPGVTLTAMWGVTTARLFTEGLELRSQTSLSRSTGALGTEVTFALQAERRQTARWLASRNPNAKAALDEQRKRTDEAVRALAGRLGRVGDAPERVKDRLHSITGAAQSLSFYRTQADRPARIDGRQVLGQYTEVVNAQIAAFQELTQVDDGGLTSRAAPLVALGHAAELASRQDALLTLARADGRLDGDELAELTAAAGSRRWLVSTQIRPFLTGDARGRFEALADSGAWRTMEAVEDGLLTARAAGGADGEDGVRPPGSPGEWRAAMDRVSAEQGQLIQDQVAGLLDRSGDVARDLLTKAAWVSAGGLAAVLLTVLLSWRITRSLSRRLSGLHTALRRAETRLPELVGRLHRGERVDVDAEAPELDYGTDELGQVAQAFNAAQRTAVSSAVELGAARSGFQRVILGVARHSQNLVNRQLALLDRLEREHQDPELLKGLYELDSTASQLRRYEENLVVITGGQPGRRWKEPVAVVDVLRGAVGEVAEYQRVSVHVGEDVWLAPHAVADVIHLLAELIENATAYSPPPSPVRVRVDVVVKGLAIEVEDQGLGMAEEEYAALNRQLAEPPPLDVVALADDLRLGMFVIGRLAAKHRVAVTLRPSVYGGTSAIVLVPDEVVVREAPEEPEPVAARADAGRARGAALPRRRSLAAAPALRVAGSGGGAAER
ncbi:sensor histidine kinase, partial [Streptomyces capparidis]